MRKGKIWAAFHLLSIALFIAAIVVLVLGVLDAYVWRYAVFIPVIVVFWLCILVTFFGMYYELDEWYDFVSWGWLFLKYQFTVYGGFFIWGIVVAIQIFCGRKD